MLKCARVVVAAVISGLLAASTVDRFSGARAASACISEPNAQIAPRVHWYYRVDPVTHRKCWYVDRPQINPQAEQPTAAAPVEQPAAQSPFSSFISQLSKLASPSTQQPSEPQVGNSTIPQTNPVAAPPDDFLSRQRAGRSDVPKSAAVRRPERTAAVTPPASSRPATTLTVEERDALFQRYLRWQDDREKHDALFQRYLQWNEQGPRD